MSFSAGRAGNRGRAPAQEPESRAACTPCRGSGNVLSSLGGDSHAVTCPWCGGDGLFHPGRDAQQEAPAGQQETPA